MRRGGNKGSVRRDRADNVAGMDKHLPIEKRFQGSNEGGMMRQPVEAFELLYVVICVDGDAVVGSQYLVSRDSIDGFNVDQAKKRILTGSQPAVSLNDSE